MTINALHKITADLIAKGHGRRLVYVDKSRITHPLESGGVCIIPITEAALHTREMANDHGGRKVPPNSHTAIRTALVLANEPERKQ